MTKLYVTPMVGGDGYRGNGSLSLKFTASENSEVPPADFKVVLDQESGNNYTANTEDGVTTYKYGSLEWSGTPVDALALVVSELGKDEAWVRTRRSDGSFFMTFRHIHLVGERYPARV